MATLEETLKRLKISYPMYRMLDHVSPTGEITGNANTICALITRGMVTAGRVNLMTTKGYETLNEIRVGFFGWQPIEELYSHAKATLAPEPVVDESWNAEDIPAGWEDGSHRPNTDYENGMTWPIVLYRGESEQEARNALSILLLEIAGYASTILDNRAHFYLNAADDIVAGLVDHAAIGGRIYRVRQGVHVNQTFGKGL